MSQAVTMRNRNVSHEFPLESVQDALKKTLEDENLSHILTLFYRNHFLKYTKY